MKLLFTLCLALVVGCRAPAPGPKDAPFNFDTQTGPVPGDFSKEADLAAAWAGPLQVWWKSGETGHLSGVGGVDLPYSIHRAANAKGAVVIVPGRVEPIVKYAEIAWDLEAQGFSTYAVEVRGQGSAGRMLPDREKGHVAAFDDYVEDLHHFINQVVKPDTTLPVFLLAHSRAQLQSMVGLSAGFSWTVFER